MDVNMSQLLNLLLMFKLVILIYGQIYQNIIVIQESYCRVIYCSVTFLFVSK